MNRSVGRLVGCLHVVVVAVLISAIPLGVASAECPEVQVKHYTGTGQVVCPCFVAGEEAGVVFTLPSDQYPIEILRVGIGWGSQFGGAPTQLENAIRIYTGGLPNPGSPAYMLPGPQLMDGYINEFDLEAQLGDVIIDSGPFTVTLEFANDNAGDPFAPSVVHDNNGCQAMKNAIFAIPGGWYNACALGVGGDWVFYVVYRSKSVIAVATPVAVDFDTVRVNTTICDTIVIANQGCHTLAISSIEGCSSAPFSIDTTMTDRSLAPLESTNLVVCVTPTEAGPPGCTITIHSNNTSGPVTIPVDPPIVTATPGFNPALYALRVSVVPNPFNPSTTIRFYLPEASPVVADVWSVEGGRVKTLAENELFEPGENTLVWDGTNSEDQPVASGVYYFRVSTNQGHRTVKAVLLK